MSGLRVTIEISAEDLKLMHARGVDTVYTLTPKVPDQDREIRTFELQAKQPAIGEGVVRKLTPLKELAEMLSMDRSSARQYILRLGFKPMKARTAATGFQKALVFTPEQVEEIVATRKAEGYC